MRNAAHIREDRYANPRKRRVPCLPQSGHNERDRRQAACQAHYDSEVRVLYKGRTQNLACPAHYLIGLQTQRRLAGRTLVHESGCIPTAIADGTATTNHLRKVQAPARALTTTDRDP